MANISLLLLSLSSNFLYSTAMISSTLSLNRAGTALFTKAAPSCGLQHCHREMGWRRTFQTMTQLMQRPLIQGKDFLGRNEKISSLKIYSSASRRFSSSSSDSSQLSDETVRTRTLRWLERVVIGMQLCPFANHPYEADQLQVDVVRGGDLEDVLSHLVLEMAIRTEKPGTVLVVCPEFSPDDFYRFLDVVYFINQEIISHGTGEEPEKPSFYGRIQIVPFHPLFEFQGSEHKLGDEDAGNWTNRSPFPIFHILRESEVSHAVKLIGGDASRVWQRNVDLLEALTVNLGKDQFVQIMRGQDDVDESVNFQVKSILKQFPASCSPTTG